MDHSALVQIALKCGATGAAIVPVEKIPFDRNFRSACEKNVCGRYGKNWMCPPDVGDIDEMISRAKSYKYAIVFQSIGQLKDSYDLKGMRAAGKSHQDLTAAIAQEIRPMLGDFLLLGAGACHICPRCAKLDDTPCRFPESATPSLEAYGISVTDLAGACGLKYINGANTVTFFGGLLF